MNEMLKSALAYADFHRQHNVNLLMELIQIPSISAKSENADDVRKAALWLNTYLHRIGMPQVDIIETGGHPVVYAEWLRAGKNKPTLLVYGHYDVQPVDPLEEWQRFPFAPTIQGEYLFGRGASDDKGQLFSILSAVDAFLSSAGQLPINLKILLEGEEEVGSFNTSGLLRKLANRLACNAILICDHDMLNPTTPTITYGARGLLYLEVTLCGLSTDLHSGTFGGAVDNPLNTLVYILSMLRDISTGRILIPEFYDRVLSISEDERGLITQSSISDDEILKITGANNVAGEIGYSTAERVSVRPTFEIHGVYGGFTDQGQKTAIPSAATAKVSMRLVPDQNPQEIKNLFEMYLHSLVLSRGKLSVNTISSSAPIKVDYNAPAIRFAAEACNIVFGRLPAYIRAGGTDPIAECLNQQLHAPIAMIGFSLPDDNTHAPNEKFYLPNFYNATKTIIHYFSLLSHLPR